MSDITNAERTHELLAALGEQLAVQGDRYELVVIGASALLALGFVTRPTRDVDLLALRDGGQLISADPLPPPLAAARTRVSRDFGVPADWLNAGPRSLLDLGLPAGFVERLETSAYGEALTVSFASRIDQIHFKLYVVADQGPGKHLSDLRALEPSRDELIRAARWTRTHDPSAGFRDSLERVLGQLGVDDADLEA